MNILILDDEKSLASALAEVLDEHGHDVALAHTFEDGMNQLSKLDLDVLITDINLTKAREGLVVLKKAKEEKPNVHVIITTAQKDFEIAKEAFRYHAYTYVTKPYDLGEILDAMGEISKERSVIDQYKDLAVRNRSLEEKVRRQEQLERLLSRTDESRTAGAAKNAIRISRNISRRDSGIYMKAGCIKADIYYLYVFKSAEDTLISAVEHLLFRSMTAFPGIDMSDPGAFLKNMNNFFLRERLDPASVFLCSFSKSSGEMVYANAGFAPLLYMGRTKTDRIKNTAGILGLSSSMEFENRRCKYQGGDRIIAWEPPVRPQGGLEKHADAVRVDLVSPQRVASENIIKQIERISSDAEIFIAEFIEENAIKEFSFSLVDHGSEIESLKAWADENIFSGDAGRPHEKRHALISALYETYAFLADSERTMPGPGSFTCSRYSGRVRLRIVCREFCIAHKKARTKQLADTIQRLTGFVDVKTTQGHIDEIIFGLEQDHV